MGNLSPMPGASAAANIHSFMRILPSAQEADVSDPVPAMRRELALLRIELENLRATEGEARKTSEFLVAEFDRIMDSRDQWRREAERLNALIAQVPRSADDEPHGTSPWSLFWRISR
jgi:hypothetical protein